MDSIANKHMKNIVSEIVEKQNKLDMDDSDFKEIVKEYTSSDFTVEDLLNGSMDAFVKLKDAIVYHYMGKPASEESIFSSVLDIHRNILASKIEAGISQPLSFRSDYGSEEE